MGIFRSVAGSVDELREGQHVSDIENWLIHGGRGRKDRSAVEVNEVTALSYTAVWSAVLQLSSAVGALPVELVKEISKGKQELLTKHPLYFLLHLMPNPEMTTMLFREALVGQMLLYGACFAEKQFDTNGNVVALWPLQSRYMNVIRRNGELFYRYHPGNENNVADEGGSNQSIIFLPRERVLHIPYLTANGIAHYAPIEETKEAIALGMALEDYASMYFKNNAKPAAVIEIPGGLSDKAAENFKASWNLQTEGLDNAHRTAILEEGIKLHEYGSTPRNSQSIEQREFQLDEVARIFNMPPHMLKNLKRATYSNIEQQMREFVMLTLNQLVVRMEQNYTIQLLKESEYRNNTYFKHNLSALLRGDTKDRWNSYAKGFNMGVWAPNDILMMEDHNTYDGGDDHYVQVAMQRVGDINDNTELDLALKQKQIEGMDKSQEDGGKTEEGKEDSKKENGTKNETKKESNKEKSKRTLGGDEIRQIHSNLDKTLQGLRENWEEMFTIAMDRIVKAEVAGIRKQVKTLDARNDLSFMDFVRGFYAEKITGMIRNILFPTFDTFMRSVQFNVGMTLGDSTDMTEHLENFIRSFNEDFITIYTGKSEAELNALLRDLAPGAVASTVIDQRLNEWEAKKSKKNARRWRNRAMNAIALVKYQDTGFVRFTWRTVGENCPFCSGLNGMTVGIRGNFVNKGEVMSGEEQLADGTKVTRHMTIKNFRKHPPLHDGCDCVVVPNA